jgi:hypothetical protein
VGVRSVDRRGQEVDLHTSRPTAQATAASRMLSPQCGCVVDLRHIDKQYPACLEVAGTLTTTATCRGRYVAILGLCCALAATIEITS